MPIKRRIAKKLGLPVAPRTGACKAKAPKGARIARRRAAAGLRRTGSGIFTPKGISGGPKSVLPKPKGPSGRQQKTVGERPRRKTPFDRKPLLKHGSLVGAR